jgi:hypothetical protein
MIAARHSLYLAVDGAGRMVERAVNANQDAIKSWNERWDTLFDSALFDIFLSMSVFAGVVAVCVWMVDELQDFDGGDVLFKKTFYKNLVWAFFVLSLMVPGGDRLEALVQGIHTFGQNFNQQALQYQLDDVALEDAIRGAVGRGTLSADISAQMAQCEGLIGERQFACLSSAHKQIQEMIDAYEDEWLLELPVGFRGFAEGLNDFLISAGNTASDYTGDVIGRPIDAAVQGAKDWEGIGSGTILGGALGAASGYFTGTMSSLVQGAVQSILLAIQWGFVNLLELSMLLTALVSPLALALSFLPGKGRPIIAWVIAYLSMVTVQLYYNLMIGFMGVVVVNSNAYDINGYLIVLAIFAPYIAFKLAKGGGIAVFEVLTAGTLGLALAAAQVGAKAITSGKGKS